MVTIEICIILLVLIAFGVGYLIYILEFKTEPKYNEKLEELICKSPYPIMFRTPDCKSFKNWNIHIAKINETNEEILVIDLDK